ncbi:hypothetical protein Dimus_031952 [Dionaea muscipula]
MTCANPTGELLFNPEIEAACRRNSRNRRNRRLAMNLENLPPPPTPTTLGNHGLNPLAVGVNQAANPAAAATDIERLLRDYANPSLLGNESSIRRPPIEANNFEIHPSIINMIRQTEISQADGDPSKVNNRLLKPYLEGDQITEGFTSLGWEPILGLMGVYYPTLVREFYVNMKEKEEEGQSSIESWVHGRRISMHVVSLAEFLGVSNEGTCFQPEGFAADDRIYKFKEAFLRLGLRYTQGTGRRRALLTKHLKMCGRLFVYIIGFNVMPRVSCLNEVRVGDVYLTDKLAHGLQGRASISLADTLIRETWAMAGSTLKGKGVSFPVLISGYIASQGVHLPEELRRWRNPTLIPPPSAAPEVPDVAALPTDNQVPSPLDVVEPSHPQMPDFRPPLQPGVGSSSFQPGHNDPSVRQRAHSHFIEDMLRRLDLQ